MTIMRRSLIVLSLSVAATPVLAQPARPPASQPAAVRALSLQRVLVQVPEPRRLKVALFATPLSQGTSRAFTRARLLLAGQDIPLATPGVATDQPGNTLIHLEVDLGALPESVLTLPAENLTVRWEGVTDGGRTVVTVAGTIDPGDRSQLTLDQDNLHTLYARLDSPSVTPSGVMLTFRGLANILNPFSFEVVVKGLEYRVVVGGSEVMAAQRPGFRLRPGQRSDVLLEAEVPLASAAMAAASVLRGAAVEVIGQLRLSTPDGDRFVPVMFRSGG
jgi:hypothetical protein